VVVGRNLVIKTNRGRLITALIVIGVLMTAIAPGTASADTDLGESGGFFYVSDSVTSTGRYPVDASCPTGTHVAGGGWGETFVTGSQPVDGPDANGTPDDGWKIGASQGTLIASEAYAVCSTQRSVYVRGRRKDVAVGQTRTVKAKCPPGTAVIAGGGALRGLLADYSRLHSSVPFDGRDSDFARDDGWLVTAPGIGEPGTLRGNAVCRNVSAVYSENPGTLPPNGGSSPIIECPATHHVVGVGLQSFGPADAGYIAALKPIDAAAGPSDDADLVPDDYGQAFASNGSGSTESFMSVATCLQ
jgi:hypothetical protein